MNAFPAESVPDVRQNPTVEGVRIGKIVHVDAQGLVYVDFNGNTAGPLAAKLTGTMQDRLLNQGWTAFSQVLMLFEEDDPGRPVILDFIAGAVRTAMREEAFALQTDKNRDVTIDGKIVTFDAEEQIVLKCGKASITLTKAGKVIIRGAYLLSRSSGVNKIKGGSVQFN